MEFIYDSPLMFIFLEIGLNYYPLKEKPLLFLTLYLFFSSWTVSLPHCLHSLYFLNACLSHWSYFSNKFVQLLIGSSLIVLFLIVLLTL